MQKKLHVALAHDYLNSWGGGERVLNAFKRDLYPEADVFTITYDPRKIAGHIEYPVHTSKLQKIPGASRFHKWFLIFMPWAVSTLDFSPYDLVLSDCSGFIKGIKTNPQTLHVCYIHTATRYLTVDTEYFRKSVPGFLQWLMPPFLAYLKKKDLVASTHPQMYIANSQETAARVKKFYHRTVDAVIFPPVDTSVFYHLPSDSKKEHYLIAGRLAPYKRFDLAIKACNTLGKKLIVIGEGPEEENLRALAGPTIEFKGKVSDRELRQAFAEARAMIFPPLEDAGMTPIEAMACGAPVIAFGKGGALESVLENKTGIFFKEQTVESLSKAIEDFEQKTFSLKTILEHAEQFSSHSFITKIKDVIDHALATHHD